MIAAALIVKVIRYTRLALISKNAIWQDNTGERGWIFLRVRKKLHQT
jgi:hypothetical protein